MIDRIGVVAASLALALVLAPGAVRAQGVFDVMSPAFKDGDAWPSKFADNRPSAQGVNACGAGENVSPPIAWVNPPAATKSFVAMMIDVDGGNGLGSVHWVAYDIPVAKRSFAEGEASKPANGWVGGTNGRTNVYSGPCPPAGHSPHHYVINVIATDIEPGTLKAGMTRDELIAALRGGHALANASIVAKYTRPQ